MRFIPNTLMLVAGAIIASPVDAGLIYTWEAISGTAATGQVEFINSVMTGDLVARDKISSNLFTFDHGFSTLNVTDLFFRYSSMEVGSLGLCVPTCDSNNPVKVAAIKTKVGNLQMASSGFYDSIWNWSITVPANVKNDPAVYYTGTGRWNQVTVPEPSSVILLLAGLVSISAVRRRIRRN